MSSTVASLGMFTVLEIAPEMNGCAAAIMLAGAPLARMKRLPVFAAAVGAVEDRQVLLLQVRRAFDRHPATDRRVGMLARSAGRVENPRSEQR